MFKKMFCLLPFLSSGLALGCGEPCVDIRATGVPEVTVAADRVNVTVDVDPGGGGCGSVPAVVESYQWDLDGDGLTDVEGPQATSISVPRSTGAEQRIGLDVQTNEGVLEFHITVRSDNSWTWQ